ncbi:hypothetical protein M2347_001776 [Chryseobacterium sp. H1D6B]|uniref:hypothetical protein n=1 Tax=Chryseobacterium sp. H1D6B TaxID=2940588 RepID=UPI0015CDAA40|nr:hypothetical protein [Chryseobacterium sp. H1D6B]MDH6252049.1 hypothetical protein [Chryseobacterium sp. H1D6B]
MRKNEDLQNLLGKIHQLVNYRIIDIEDLSTIQTFCNEEKERIATGSFIELIEKDKWKEDKIYEQRDTDRIHSESAIPMIWEYLGLNSLNDKYKRRLELSKEVADDIFLSVNEIDIFLGEDDNGLIFMCKLNKGASFEYYVINNTLKKKPILEGDFNHYRTSYEEGLKPILDRYLQANFATSINTRKFTVGSILYKELLTQSGTYSNIVISFYPAIHVTDYLTTINVKGAAIQVNYRSRLTFVMILEYYLSSQRYQIGGSGVYDRNGLCPPPDNSNC